jgi:hypothetical protein
MMMAGMLSLGATNTSLLLGRRALAPADSGSVLMKESGMMVLLLMPSIRVQVSVAGTVGAAVEACVVVGAMVVVGAVV